MVDQTEHQDQVIDGFTEIVGQHVAGLQDNPVPYPFSRQEWSGMLDRGRKVEHSGVQPEMTTTQNDGEMPVRSRRGPEVRAV